VKQNLYFVKQFNHDGMVESPTNARNDNGGGPPGAIHRRE
jgi:hypothetical protein